MRPVVQQTLGTYHRNLWTSIVVSVVTDWTVIQNCLFSCCYCLLCAQPNIIYIYIYTSHILDNTKTKLITSFVHNGRFKKTFVWDSPSVPAGTALTTLISCVLDFCLLSSPATWRRSSAMWKWHQQLRCSPSPEDITKTHFLTKSIWALEVCASLQIQLFHFPNLVFVTEGWVPFALHSERHWRSLWV